MLSIAELAHKRYPKAIAKMLCQELQPLDIEQLDVAVDIVDSSLEIQIRADSVIEKEKLLALVHSKLQNLHIESVAKFRIHCWRNDEETHEQRPLWTEQFMLDLPKSSLKAIPDIDPKSDSQQFEARSPEPQLSKQSVLQNAIKKIASSNSQARKNLLATDLEQQSLANGKTVKSSDLVKVNKPQIPTSDSNYWQLLFVGLSIVALGLGIGALVRALTSKTAVESSSSSSLATPSVENKEIKSTITTPKSSPSETIQPSVAPTQVTPKTNPSVEPIASAPNELEQEPVITLEKFNRIQKGMTIEQVEKVFGTSGKIIAENNSSNSIGQVYSWKNPEGSNAVIEFKDGQVVAKAQAGL
ncbi:MAG: hypothetical protein IM585_10130 [Pseudanabaena sp. M135S2SP2A07QC]|jgi:hypothetical protein|nr:hypothetical protein [Pseudanabaena sp. M090S1SP2A07QC]MCA6506118.1 hypothetical protein [Pseudanabaena sp. M172S2SP2A07QC]MCA6522549.1 hypothetical protein [Pseudanabaena sp. M051S1SP2A07QC]MCA6527561.1 hypothetical protein [Pseudanabaena sp. M179S2SP2A07QC]MCA6532516.1 hypothetical protein [Pseudanabaena sp. M125S2SP2A07QC]MCA6532813.1 hypothetical protein [Pseudanabaena sp. M176S2SP2A07QC]MCA6540714.1 hypothetical protein [Pseudanabaena sp. M037S2SP2A07QC]MCA6549710.1 hypothetical prot